MSRREAETLLLIVILMVQLVVFRWCLTQMSAAIPPGCYTIKEQLSLKEQHSDKLFKDASPFVHFWMQSFFGIF